MVHAALHKHGILTIDSVPKIAWYEDLGAEMRKPYAQELLSIPGQRSGVSLAYFYMLTGSPGLSKPDRMVIRFLARALGKAVSVDEAQGLVCRTCRRLNDEYPDLTARVLDHEIWKYESGG